MGYYTELSQSSYSAKDTALQNRMAGVKGSNPYVNMAIQAAPQLLTFTIGKILSGQKADGKGGADNAGNAEDAKRQELLNNLKSALNKIGASDERDINEAVSRAQNKRDEKVNAAQAEVDQYTNGTDKYSTEIAQLQSQLESLNAENDPNGVQKSKIESKIKSLENKKQEAFEKAQTKLAEVTKTENAKLEEISLGAENAFKILTELAELNKVGDQEVNLEEKQEALHEFNELRTKFSSANTTEADKKAYAEKLKELYENNPNDKTIQAAYEKILKQKVEAALK